MIFYFHFLIITPIFHFLFFVLLNIRMWTIILYTFDYFDENISSVYANLMPLINILLLTY